MRGLRRPSRRFSLRRTLQIVHLYLGLTVGLYLCVVGATGSILVFRDEIDAFARPETVYVASPSPEGWHARASLESILVRLHATYPNANVNSFTTVTLPKHEGGAYSVYRTEAGHSSTLTIDPYDGHVLRETSGDSPLLTRIEDLHVNLSRKAKGEVANGYASLIAVVLLITGLTLWWPKTMAQFKARLVVHWKSGTRRVIHDLHNVVGFYSLLLLLIVALTGVALVFNDPVERVVYRLVGTPTIPRLVRTSLSTVRLPVDVLLVAARHAAPDADATFLTLPTHPGQAFYCLLQKRGPGTLPYISVYVDSGTGQVLSCLRDDSAPTGRRIMGSIPPLHFGSWGGLSVKIIYAMAGLSPTFLYVTGGLIWLRKRRKSLHTVTRQRGSRAADISR